MRAQKTIFITVGESSVTRNFLRGTFWQFFSANLALRIVLIASKGKGEDYRKEFGNEHVEVEELPLVPQKFLEKILSFIGRNALKTGTTTMNQMRQYVDFGGVASLILKRILWYTGRSKAVFFIIQKLELLFTSHPLVQNLFQKYNPDAILATVMINGEIDVPLLREAKRKKILTVGMLRGWDNFTTHGLLRITPDHLLLQNEYLKEMGVTYNFLNPERVRVVGFPQNDWYFKKELLESREQFLRRLGIDPKKRMIIYGAMGDYLFPREGEIAEVFEELVLQKKIPDDLVLLFRAHPAFTSPLEKMKSMKYVIPDRSAIYRSNEVSDWEMGEREMAYLINSIVHSEMMINAGSTMAIDAVALGKAAISVAFEKTPIKYWLSARRFRRHYTHYQDLMATGGVAYADSPEDLANVINSYLKDPSRGEKGRRALREKFLEPYDGNSGERIAKIILKLLQIRT